MLRLLIIAGLLGLSAPATAAEGERTPTISLTARGTASAVPDMAALSFAVHERATTAAEALEAASATVRKALTALGEAGVESRDIQTSQFSVQPVIVYPDRSKSTAPGDEVAPRVVGYRVTQGLDVRLREIGKLGGILDRMVEAGMNSIGSIAFTNADQDTVREAARRDAVGKAIRRAGVLAEASGTRLGRILSIREGALQTPRPTRGPQMRSAQAMEAVPIATGETDYSVTVTMEWAIEQ